MVIVSAEPASRREIAHDARQAELKTGVQADPLVQAVLARFPGAEIVDVRKAEVAQQRSRRWRSRRRPGPATTTSRTSG